MDSKKYLKIWPVWIIFSIMFIIIGNPEIIVNLFFLALFLSYLIYYFNVKKFGKKYWSDSK
ncbi:unnamed protein product [marine sediment metagenome]|uniref:Uncharacterized protein n=1 Tax=marine sediment metagenome TaxID=412755 RepID=X0XI04_9ZZZZ